MLFRSEMQLVFQDPLGALDRRLRGRLRDPVRGFQRQVVKPGVQRSRRIHMPAPAGRREQLALIARGFALDSIHPGHDLAEVKASTGFRFAHDANLGSTAVPDLDMLSLWRGRVLDELAETYPAFSRQMRHELAS